MHSRLLATFALLAILLGCRSESEHTKHAPRPYLAWEDHGNPDTAKYYFNEVFLGVGDEGFRKQMQALEKLDDGSTLAVFVPSNEFLESSDSMAPIPFHRKPELEKRFETTIRAKRLSLVMYQPEFSQGLAKEVPGISSDNFKLKNTVR